MSMLCWVYSKTCLHCLIVAWKWIRPLKLDTRQPITVSTIVHTFFTCTHAHKENEADISIIIITIAYCVASLKFKTWPLTWRSNHERDRQTLVTQISHFTNKCSFASLSQITSYFCRDVKQAKRMKHQSNVGRRSVSVFERDRVAQLALEMPLKVRNSPKPHPIKFDSYWNANHWNLKVFPTVAQECLFLLNSSRQA